MKTEWEKEYLNFYPSEFQKLNDSTWIQRKNIHEDTISSLGYICDSRFISNDVKEDIELLQEVINDMNNTSEYIDGYNASLILLGGQTNNLESRAIALRPIIEASSQYLDDNAAISAPEMFPPWEIGVTYKQGIRITRGLILYKCLQTHTSQNDWLPENTPSLWLKMDNPKEEWPEWHQPTGGHDAYEKGYKVSHKDKHWISEIDANVWEPGVYGWIEV